MTLFHELRAPDPEAPGGTPARRGSVTLRETGEGAGQDRAALLDPANQSLADALKMMLFLLKIAMSVLVVMYLLSGLGKINEGERGIRLLFGAVQADNLLPGFQYSAPFPLGELQKINQGYSGVDLDREFWVEVKADQMEQSPDKLPPTASIKPSESSGSVLTSDGNVAHTRWKVGYTRDNVKDYSQNVLPGDEEKIVRMAARRGVVHACAMVPITTLLTQSAESSFVVNQAQSVAQATLDRFESGLRITTFSLQIAIPPTAVRADFEKVQSASANAAKAIEEARGEARNTLLRTAGEAADYVIYYLDEYEKQIATKDQAAMDRTLATIDSLLKGEGVDVPPISMEIAGQAIKLPGGRVQGMTGGEVAQVLAEAQTYRSSVVSRATSDLRRFEAKLEQYKVNPLVMVQREWSDAVSTFMGRDTVQTALMPLNATTNILDLNSDPDVLRDIDMAAKLRLRKENEAQRLRMLEQDKYKTSGGSGVLYK